MESVPYEIERKFLIRYPDEEMLARKGESSRITQTYLLGEHDTSERVRLRERDGVCVYTHTVKRRITDMRRVEIEREISREEYLRLLQRADPERRTIEKTRWCLPYAGQLLEIDLFPFWNDRAYLEIELKEEGQALAIPPELEVIREVTDDIRYTNSSLAREIPRDEI